MTKLRTLRSCQALSIIELLVVMVITGIAVAGLAEVLWINGAFSYRVFNKVDNISAANAFFEIFGRDARSAKSIGNQHVYFAPYTQPSSSSPSDIYIDPTSGNTYEIGAQGNVQTIIFQVPYVPVPKDWNPSPTTAVSTEQPLLGFPMQWPEGTYGNQPVLDTVVYQADLNAGTITRYFFPDPHYSTNPPRVPIQTTVLTNLEGPTSTGGMPEIFDYVNSAGIATAAAPTPFITPLWPLMGQIQSIMVNVEIHNTGANSGGMSNGGQSANIGIRREFFMRNHAAAENVIGG